MVLRSFVFIKFVTSKRASIIVGVRNNDGLDFDGSMFGDLQSGTTFTVNF
ncbi:MAG: hypothetical protein HN576_01460 [Bacteriovoracaceae bacterium]|nr:hypothetical protein [Bacteriovoracaceae bacterium]